jgi:hypothetical protein
VNYTYIYFQLPVYEKEFEKMWQDSSASIKKTYGRKYVDGMLKSLTALSSKSCSTIAPIVDAIEMTVIAKNPKQRYLVDGSSSLVDQDNVSLHYSLFYLFLYESVQTCFIMSTVDPILFVRYKFSSIITSHKFNHSIRIRRQNININFIVNRIFF